MRNVQCILKILINHSTLEIKAICVQNFPSAFQEERVKIKMEWKKDNNVV